MRNIHLSIFRSFFIYLIKKPTLFIDGTNLYAGQYELFGPQHYLNFPVFIQLLEEKMNIIFGSIYFYASYSPRSINPSKKEKLFLKNEALFYQSVKQQHKTIFFKGYRSHHNRKEKEVDVHLALDIVHKAHLKEYDNMYLISGDADIMYAIQLLHTMNKNVHILAFQTRIPHRFIDLYPTTILILDKERYLKKKKNLDRKKKFIYIDKSTIQNNV